MEGWPEWMAAFPDSSATIDEMVVEGDRVVVYMTGRGTHTGEFQEMAPANRRFEETWLHKFRIED